MRFRTGSACGCSVERDVTVLVEFGNGSAALIIVEDHAAWSGAVEEDRADRQRRQTRWHEFYGSC